MINAFHGTDNHRQGTACYNFYLLVLLPLGRLRINFHISSFPLTNTDVCRSSRSRQHAPEPTFGSECHRRDAPISLYHSHRIYRPFQLMTRLESNCCHNLPVNWMWAIRVGREIQLKASRHRSSDGTSQVVQCYRK